MPYLGNQHIVGDSVHNFKVLDDISSYTETFDGSASSVVSTSAETIKISNHRFINGQRVTYNNGGGSNIGGLSSGTAYYVIYDSAHTIKLATSASHAASLTAINISAVGGGTSHTLNAAFDGVNKKFRITHSTGTRARFSQASQLRIAINNVIQKANNDHRNFSEGYAIEVRNIIVFQTAPTVNDIFFGSLLGETLGTFDISDHKIDNHTGDGSTIDFSLTRNVPNVECLLVSLNGVIQHPSDATTTRSYSLLVDNIIRFTTAPALGVEIQIRHLGFAGASTGEVSGFYGRTGNVGLTTNDHITTGDITSRNINASGIITASSFIGDGSGLIGVASTDNIVTGTAATFNTYPVDINAGMTVAGVSTMAAITATTGTFSGAIDLNADLDVDGHTNLDNVSIAGVTTFAETIKFPDAVSGINSTNAPVLKFGNSDDLIIGHDGSNSRIRAAGAGSLILSNPNGIRFQNSSTNHPLLVAIPNGSVSLWNANSKKLETDTKGIVVGTGVTIETNGQATFVGVVTFGSGSTTIDNNVVNVGTALTLGHTQGLQFHTQNLHSAGFEINQINASGIITASSLDIGGNVSIGGTLTYEDVTNIDSVGIVTATAGDFDDFVSVGSNVHLGNAGVVTATTFSGSGASLTNLNASNIASGTVPTARLGSGTANNTTFLRGDSTFQTVVTDLVNDTSPQLGGNLDVNTKNIVFGDSGSSSDDRLTFGAGTDLSIYHDASHSRITNTTGNLVIDNSNGVDMYLNSGNDIYIRPQGSENGIKLIGDGAAEIYHNDVKALSTSSTGINVWGNSGNGILDIYPTGSAVYSILNLHNVAGGSAFNAQLIASSGQAVYLGSGGTGDVVLRTGNSQNKVRGVHNAQVELFYSSSKKLETTNTGIYVYGDTGFGIGGSGSLFGGDSNKVLLGNGNDMQLYHDGTNSYITNTTNYLYLQSDSISLAGKSAGQNYLVANLNGAVTLHHSGNARLTTATTGVNIDGTGALKIPTGTTAQRPSAATGMLRFNSENSKVEFYNGSSWAEVGISAPFAASGGSEDTSSRSGYKIHTFTSPGTFTVTGDDTSKTVEVLVIGGGGAGGEGGGGAGALRFSNSYPVSPGNYPVSIGGGGSGNQGHGNNGSTSNFSGFSAPGGGGGGGSSRSNGNPGGSGGGSRRDNGGSRGNGASSGGSNNSNSPSSGWGNRGGSGNIGNWCGGGGGGGAGGVGGQGNGGGSNSERGGPGGSGLAYSINGSSTTRAGGGGGGCEGAGNPSAPGRATSVNGGGGRGGVSNQVPGSFGASAGSSNTGGGGGGNASTSYSGGNHSGGSGIVIVAYTV